MDSAVRTEVAGGGAIERWAVLGLRIAVPLAIVAAYVWRIVALDPADRFFDDFFYYLKAAENWVHGAGSTWFPGEPTNGYHPLWFLWVAFLIRLTAGADGIMFALLDVSIAALLVGFFFLFERFLRRLTGERLAAAAGAGFAALKMATLAATGVEMALTCCIAAGLLERFTRKPLSEQSARDAALIGFLGALLVLARLDAVMLAPGLAVVAALRWDVKRFAAAAIGAAPAYAYAAFNLVAYGHVATTSMAAKSLRFYMPPNLHAFIISRPMLMFALTLVAASVVIIVLVRRCENADARRIALALVAAPVLQLVAQLLMSGWMMFEWYFYFGVMVLGVGVALLVCELRRLDLLRRLGIPLGLLAAILAPVLFAGGMRPNPSQGEIARVARRLDAFSQTHPGVYAMGDAAGTPGWMMKAPLVHLEGLMMSHAFLDRIRNQRPLQETFRDYRVDYYVTARADAVGLNGCLDFAEPNASQASPRAPKMWMTICAPPVEAFAPWGGYSVRIYRIDRATGQAVAP